MRRLIGSDVLALVGVACWAGLGAGLVELGVILGRIELLQHGLPRRNSHYLWMVPAANAAILGSCGAVMGIALRRFPGIGRGVAVYGLSLLAFLVPLLAIPGIRAFASLVLAIGLAAWVGPIIGARPEAFARFVRRGCWSGSGGGWTGWRLRSRRHRPSRGRGAGRGWTDLRRRGRPRRGVVRRSAQRSSSSNGMRAASWPSRIRGRDWPER